MFWPFGVRSRELHDDRGCAYGFRADDSDVVRVRLEGVQRDVCKKGISGRFLASLPEFGLTLSEQKSNPDTGQVEPIEPSLDFIVYLTCIVRSLPLEHPLRDRSHGGVVSSLDVLQKFCKLGIVIPDFWGPNDPRGLCVVPTTRSSQPGESTMQTTE